MCQSARGDRELGKCQSVIRIWLVVSGGGGNESLAGLCAKRGNDEVRLVGLLAARRKRGVMMNGRMKERSMNG